ncbi:MAG: HlyD family efflux transporter periplasmic adaptor subunit [Candidatus Taylorbacteria bacterium]
MSTKLLSKIREYARAHKLITTIIVLAVIGGGYYWYRSMSTSSTTPQYVLSPVRIGSIIQTVSGTGQVSASNQTDIQSQVSGTIESINVSVGQTVSAGDLIATIDSTNAKMNLDNSLISFAKLTEPAKAADISNAQNSVAKSYNDGFNSMSSIYLDLPAIMTGMKSLLYSQTGFLSDQNANSLSPTSLSMRNEAGTAYDAAATQYQNSLSEFHGLTRESATSSIDFALTNTFKTIQMVAKVVTAAQNTITFVVNTQPDYQSKNATAAAANANSWTSQVNSDLSGLMSAINSIQSSQNTYSTLINGADQYDIQTAKIGLEQQQRTYANYFIRAPYDGIIGRIPVNVYGQAGGGTTMATIVGTDMMATISLDEVNAAKVKVGQPATITFNAISDITATGTVSVVDQIGTVTSGVVSYGVKIIINTKDSRIKPGMSLNTNITTYEKDGVIVVPSGAVKTQSGNNYVQAFDQATVKQYNNSNTQGRTVTISTNTQPLQVTVVTGDSDDTNIEIVSGLTRGQFVVTKTITSGSAVSNTAAPSILSSLTGNRGGGGARPGGN